jgi:hypothetical protein
MTAAQHYLTCIDCGKEYTVPSARRRIPLCAKCRTQREADRQRREARAQREADAERVRR